MHILVINAHIIREERNQENRSDVVNREEARTLLEGWVMIANKGQISLINKHDLHREVVPI